jgi:peroxiredoxin Q/BCP
MLNQPAPEFTLEATTGQNISLKDLLGDFVVLIFYPANDTPICNKQLNDISINNNDFCELNARVFGVNTASAGESRSFCTRKRLEFPILSDPDGTTAKSYNAYMKWFPMNKRVVVIIDPKGMICFYEKGKPAPEKILEAIKEASAKMSPVS